MLIASFTNILFRLYIIVRARARKRITALQSYDYFPPFPLCLMLKIVNRRRNKRKGIGKKRK